MYPPPDMIIHPEVLSIYCCLFCLGLQELAKGLELSSVENKDDLWILDRFFIIFQSSQGKISVSRVAESGQVLV